MSYSDAPDCSIKEQSAFLLGNFMLTFGVNFDTSLVTKFREYKNRKHFLSDLDVKQFCDLLHLD